MPKLTKRVVDAVRPGARDVHAWDSELPGFGLKVTPSGRRSYFCYYRTREGVQRRPKIGDHGPLTCEEARAIARRWLAEVALGGDPSADRRRLRPQEASKPQLPIVADLAVRHMHSYVSLHKKAGGSRLNDELLWILHILPRMGWRPVADITTADVAALHEAMGGSRPHILWDRAGRKFRLCQEAHKANANRARALLSKAFNLAELWGWRQPNTNPTRGVQRFPEAKRQWILSSGEAIRLGAALRSALEEGRVTRQWFGFILLSALHGTRKSELLTAKRAWLDRSVPALRLPDSKTGERLIYLSRAALLILDALPVEEGNPYLIIGGRPGQHLVNPYGPWRMVTAEAGVPQLRLHDLRHNFATTGARSGLTLALVGALLGHREPETTQRYVNFVTDDPLRDRIEQVASSVATALGLKPGRCR